MNRRLFLAMTAASALAAAAPLTVAHAKDAEAARAFVQNVSNDILALIRSPAPQATKRAEFMAAMERYANLRQVAGFALGRYQRTIPDALKPRYIEAFKRFVAATYVDRFGEYAGETITVGGARPTNDGYMVETTVNSGPQSYTVLWDISDRSGDLRVEDFVMEGISMAQSQRGEFTSLIDSYGGDLERFVQFIESRG